MSRGAAKEASNQLGITNAVGGQANSNANSLYNTLVPQLGQMAANPQGYSPQDLTAMNTASQQALGGATAGITGQANLTAARRRNSAGLTSGLDQSARTAQQTGSQNALDIQAQNANVKQAQQQEALKQLEGLYGTNVGETLGAYGQGAGDINAQTSAENNTLATDQFVQSLLGSGSGGLGVLGGGF